MPFSYVKKIILFKKIQVEVSFQSKIAKFSGLSRVANLMVRVSSSKADPDSNIGAPLMRNQFSLTCTKNALFILQGNYFDQKITNSSQFPVENRKTFQRDDGIYRVHKFVDASVQ